MSALRLFVADGLVLFGALSLGICVIALLRIPDRLVKLHLLAAALLVGVGPILLAACVASEAAVALRAALVGLFLLITTSVGAHALARVETGYRADEADEDTSGPRPPVSWR